MPIINTFETDKFHALTTRLNSKQKFDKQTSAETLRTFAPKPDPESSTPEQTFKNGATIPNSTVRRNSVLTLDSHMQTLSGDHIYLSASINPKFDLDKISSTKTSNADLSSSIGLQTSEAKLKELKTLHQQLVNLSQTEPDKPIYEPRPPTMESIKRAIERARKEEIEHHQSTITDDVNTKFFATPSVAVTSPEAKQEITKKVGKKVKKIKAKIQTGIRKKNKPKKLDPKINHVSVNKKE